MLAHTVAHGANCWAPDHPIIVVGDRRVHGDDVSLDQQLVGLWRLDNPGKDRYAMTHRPARTASSCTARPTAPFQPAVSPAISAPDRVGAVTKRCCQTASASAGIRCRATASNRATVGSATASSGVASRGAAPVCRPRWRRRLSTYFRFPTEVAAYVTARPQTTDRGHFPPQELIDM